MYVIQYQTESGTCVSAYACVCGASASMCVRVFARILSSRLLAETQSKTMAGIDHILCSRDIPSAVGVTISSLSSRKQRL